MANENRLVNTQPVEDGDVIMCSGVESVASLRGDTRCGVSGGSITAAGNSLTWK